ncbi:cupin domain-containing protein [Dyadobacter subterraneus]|uniref:Cupin domain-containing protein n=1 Tax=Dyadobacter subterraneus TaxID=2773304 RepID=A0ABR9WLU2_9BACT|nr:cupin domain-containing protein [Dyadobacter subterraneus]MBE9466484.1 cupin domain-containing protein [Dyadobacter subterraneus]
MSEIFHNRIKIVLQIFVVSCFVTAAYAQNAAPFRGQLRLTQKEVIAKKAPEGKLAPGSSGYEAVKVIVLYGDPSKPGLYTILLEVEPNTTIAAHDHPDDRIGTVVSGTWHFGYGSKFDAAKLKTLPVGSVYSEGPGVNHFAQTGDTKVIVSITGYGPTGTTYVNAADDPTKKKPAAK